MFPVLFVAVIVLLVLILWTFSQQKRSFNKEIPYTKPLIIAHRGASGTYPENTHAAFKAAIDFKADYIEFDIQLTKDKKFAVIHDPTLERTTNGKGKVSDFIMNDLKKLDAGSWKSTNYCGEQIPTLEEMLSRYYGKVKLLIEVKHSVNHEEVASLLAKQLTNYKIMNDNIIVQSFDTEFLQVFHKQLPHVPLGVLVRHQYNGLKNKQIKAFSKYASYINPKITMVNEKLITTIHTHNANCVIWTLNKKQQVSKLSKLKPNGIATDYPEWFN